MKDHGIIIERLDNNAFTPKVPLLNTIMLVLTKFRNINKAVDLVLEKAEQYDKCVISYSSKINLAQYFVETDIGFYPSWKKECEHHLLKHFELLWKRKVESIAEIFRTKGLPAVTYVRAGNFVMSCLDIIQKEKPSLIVTTRSHKPNWLRGLFDSVANRLTSQTTCPVIEA